LELEILASQSLIAARKYIQAIEKFRRIQADLLSKVQHVRAQGPQIGQQQPYRFDVQNLAIQLEILCADCMNQHSLLGEKIESYQRILELSRDFWNVKPIM